MTITTPDRRIAFGLARRLAVTRSSANPNAAPKFEAKRLRREWRTITAMTRIYCRDHHQPGTDFCPECRALLNYAAVRLDRCRFGEEKPTCVNCPVHCYQRDWRERVQTMMRYAGPRMLWRHPLLSLWHWLDGFRKAPAV